jgi:hypothetical protein
MNPDCTLHQGESSNLGFHRIAVESLQVKLIVRLDRYKTHVRLLHRLGNSLLIKIVVLVGLQKRFHKLCSHKVDFVSL